ncbi:MAG: phospho-N-acetylmuramoyl-pentapeptide-transferase [Candidatus Sumerlaeaceae bacterium]|nr:phospho-N-acetylmuramoyl-pentapeptide-transferase [Candidatus Sumerlaeaceae bacterium]
MIYHLLDFLHGHKILYINPFQYETVRAGAALVFSLLFSLAIGNRVIAMLRALKAGQPIRKITIAVAPDLAEMHGKKAGTPTMGGILIIASLLGAVFLFCDLTNPLVWLLILVTFGFGTLGFLDDYLKITKKNADGLSAKKKIIGQVVLGLFVGAYLYFMGGTSVMKVEYTYLEGGQRFGPFEGYGYVLVPFFKWIYPKIGIFFILYTILLLVATSNAVNLTDGLDGLCIGIMTIVALSFTILTYIAASASLSTYLMLPHVPKADDVVVFMGALIGACLGFFWFNAYPADMFMGDTGSLSLGGIIGTVALICKQEVLLGIIGGIFVIECLSVIIQVTSFKLFKRRVFLMSPLHHHYEKKGMTEAKIIARFWIVSILMALIGLSTLKLR